MTIIPPEETAVFAPSSEQLERERELKRFNRLYIYLPVGIVVAMVIGLLVLMLIGIFAPGLVGAEVFLSGLADTIMVLWMIPMSVLCAFGPIAYIAYVINRRQRRAELPPDSPLLEHSRAQMAMWQAQDISKRIDEKTETISDRVASPFYSLSGFVAYVEAWLIILSRPFRRDNNNEPYGDSNRDGVD
jgi:hypothetical protein